MIRSIWPALLTLATVTPLAAQNGREQFVQTDTALDAAHAVQQAAFIVLRDSTSTISAAGARLMSDLTPSSSLEWMRTRARAVASACARSEAPLATARAVTGQGQWTSDQQKQAQANLLKAMPGFADELKECRKRWSALAMDTSQVSLRESAPYQMQQLLTKLDRFNQTARTYLRSIGVKLPPPGATKP